MRISSKQGHEIALAERAIQLTNMPQRAVIEEHVLVGRPIDVGIARLISPGIGSAGVGIGHRAIPAAVLRRRIECHLVTVPHCGSSDIGELEERRQLQSLLGLGKPVVALLGHNEQRAIHIVRIDQVHHRCGGLRRIIVAHGAIGVIELARRQSRNVISAVVVVVTPVHRPHESGDVLSEAVIHV